jgi:hypothetical protein
MRGVSGASPVRMECHHPGLASDLEPQQGVGLPRNDEYAAAPPCRTATSVGSGGLTPPN